MYSPLILACFLSFSIAQNTTDTSAQNATASTLIYGYPLLAFSRLASLLVPAFGANSIYHLRALSTASSVAVVKPNVDTVYSAAIFDLSQNDISLTVPVIPSSQFALFSLYDPYGDNFANIGTGNVNQSGQYLLRNRGESPYGVQETSGADAQYVATVDSPSSFGILLVRILVNATNLDAVHSYQDGILLNNTSSHSGTGPALTSLNYKTTNTTTPAQNALNLLAALAAYDQPETEDEVSDVQAFLQTAGVGNGSYTTPSGVDLDAANATAISSIVAAVSNASNSVTLNNGWSITAPAVSGNFNNGSNYAYRAAVASSGYLMLQAPNAVYPSWVNDSASGSAFGSSQYLLGPNDSYIYSFSAKPPLLETGFWSLTAYEDNFLIPNAQNVYAVGDRSNLTYPDGSLVYGSNASRQDGPFQVIIQAADNPPPANWTSNWIPGPAGGGNMTAVLRWYGAQDALLNGSYVYPVVTRQKSAGAANGTTSGNGTSTVPPLTTPTGTVTPSTGGAVGAGSIKATSVLIAAALLVQLCAQVV